MRKKKIKKNMKDVSTFTFDPPPKKGSISVLVS